MGVAMNLKIKKKSQFLINQPSGEDTSRSFNINQVNQHSEQQESISNTVQSDDISEIIKDYENEEAEKDIDKERTDKILLQNKSRKNTSLTHQYDSNSALKRTTTSKLQDRIINLKGLTLINTKLPRYMNDTMEYTNRDSHLHIDIIPEFNEFRLDDSDRGGKTLNFQREHDDLLSPDPIGVRQKLKQIFLNRLINVSEFQVEFKFGTFLKFMIYHLLFFYLGPLASILVLIFDTKQIVNNMSFWITTGNKASFFTQIIQWIATITVCGSWAQKQYRLFPIVEINLDYIFLEQLFFFNLMVLIRSFVIAVRYGYTSQFRLTTLRNSNQDLSYIAQDLLLPTWINFNPEGLDLEIEASMWRNQVEPETFKFTFIEELEKNMGERLLNKNYYANLDKSFKMKNYKQDISSFKASIRHRRNSLDRIDIYNNDYDMFGLHSQRNITLTNLKEKKYCGNLLLREIALFAGAHQRSTALFMTLSIIGKLSLPFIARYITYERFELPWDSSIYTAFDSIATSLFLLQNYFFVAAGHVDFQRRYNMMKSVSALITPFKDNYDIKFQIFPTINLVSKESLHAWFQLRCCVMDFGRKYMMRIFMYSSVFLGMYLFYAAFLLMSFFGFLQFEFSLVFNMICIFDIVIILGLILSMFFYGAAINEEFVENKLQLIKIKQILIYSKSNLRRIINKNTKFSAAYLKIFQKIFQQLFQDKRDEFTKIQKSFTSDLILLDLKIHIDDLIEQIDSIIQRLEVENEHRPLKLLGLKATYAFMNQIYTTLFTLAVAISQRFYSGGNTSYI
ncbi:UNKNOWN [Stylonychia lemnae]|uniref:Transmembrane protein n=1 Tax=Stylonychia lemnae TaxID=5949 RepID=A0A078A5C1_STYLE|nr:UNKNOWN [Stylonychia lemnae]|eukprot:CDW75954.1 UNKNOWN [Stylonychia lemnae]